MKQYQTPEIKVCEVEIESGFAATEVTTQNTFGFEAHDEVDM
jgi:hypothetical protein